MRILQRDRARIRALSDRLINNINARIEQVVRNGDPNGYPGCVNLSFSYVEGESLLMALKVRPLSLSCHARAAKPVSLGRRALLRQCMHLRVA